MTSGQGWVTQLQSALASGADPVPLFDEYVMRVTFDDDERRFTPIPREAQSFLTAYESNDVELLQRLGWANDDGVLTREATRLLLDSWDREDDQSS